MGKNLFYTIYMMVQNVYCVTQYTLIINIGVFIQILINNIAKWGKKCYLPLGNQAISTSQEKRKKMVLRHFVQNDKEKSSDCDFADEIYHKKSFFFTSVFILVYLSFTSSMFIHEKHTNHFLCSIARLSQ